MPRINSERLMQDLRQLRSFGAEGTGVVRLALTEIDMRSRKWLARRLAEAGLEPTIDGIGTVYGKSSNMGPALIVGSHSDTQPTGGWLDGALGVIYGLEIARALAEAPETSHLAVDVVSWMDEEGTFSGLLGSRSFVGDVSGDDFARIQNHDGVSLENALAMAGLAQRPRLQLDPDRHLAYFEAHIEQGPQLEIAGKVIGVVTSIVGIREYKVRFTGQRNHAGTTSMTDRRDAGMALVSFISCLNEAFIAVGDRESVWTVGRIDLIPGALSVIPGQADMFLQIRASSNATLDAFERIVFELAAKTDGERGVGCEVAPFDEPNEPALMDEVFQEHLARAAERVVPGRWIPMPSGAGHDAQILASRIPSAMLFVPSIGGISHDFTEDTSEEDIVTGCQVAADAVASFLLERVFAK